MKKTAAASVRHYLAILATALLASLPFDSQAISNCAIGLKQSTVAPTIDGIDGGGTEWSDAATSLLDSSVATSCLDPLMDYDMITDSYPDRNITIRSKRYQRGTTWYLGFLFTVRDETKNGKCGIGNDELCVGETIVMQFNPHINGDEMLVVGEDRRFLINHKWKGSSADPNPNVIETTYKEEPAISDTLCTATANRQFGAPSGSSVSYKLQKGISGGGYSAEIEVPVSYINASGTLNEDIGISIAVINEFGKDSFAGTPDYECKTLTGSCEAAGSSFPNTLKIINYENPVEAPCELGWTIPKQWGVGYLEEPPGDYSISRQPSYWQSDAITVYECDSLGYTYYPDHPCRARIEAEIQNTGAVVTKKVVFLWARHGTGDPANYNFVDLKDVVLASGTTPTPVATTISSDLWDDVPGGEANHPCLRVYVFPDSIIATDEDILRGTTSGGVIDKAQLDTLVSNYRVQTNHWAQKNISRHSTPSDCPDNGCRISRSDWLENIRIRPINSAFAAMISDSRVSHVNDMAVPAFVSGDLLQFGKDNVMVEVKTVAYKLLPPGEQPAYNLLERFGGIVQVYPVSMIGKMSQAPLEFLVSNFSDETRRIKLLTELYKPATAAFLDLEIEGVNGKVITLQPHSEVVVHGSLRNQGSCGPWPAFLCDMSIAQLLVLLIILFIIVILFRKLRA
jgi:hypothetical protein